ncbi:MAG: hypothetical protein Q8L19_11450, partial [Reyranella sp.]|nr:hypothetical protein [Reyranella sp.]
MKKIIAATTISQLRTEAGAVCMEAGPCAKPQAPSSGINVAKVPPVLRFRPAPVNRFVYEQNTP